MTQFRAHSNKRPQSKNRAQHVQTIPINQTMPIPKQVAGNSPRVRQVQHPSHTQMLNAAIGLNQGPILQTTKHSVMKQQQLPTGRNLSVGRQGTTVQNNIQQIHVQKTPSNNSKGIVNQQKFSSERVHTLNSALPTGVMINYQTNFQ